jgi:hypothetical protein
MIDRLPETPEAPASHVRARRGRREVKAQVINVDRLSKRELDAGRTLYPEDEHADVQRPATRGGCVGEARPCPFVACPYHLYLDVNPRSGAVKINFPDLEPDELVESCALDVADRGGETLENIGAIMNLTRERVRQVEMKAIAKLQGSSAFASLLEDIDDGPNSRRRLPVIGDRYFDAEGFASDALDDV